MLERDGVRIHYEEHGEGPAILLSHGFCATLRMWQGQVDAFGGDYRIITWDMRGHGQTDSPTELAQYSAAEAVEDMSALLDDCGIERAIVGGHSLGGYLSLEFHLAYPERVRALMLFNTGPGYKNDQSREAWNETAEARARAFDEKGLDALGVSPEIGEHRGAEGLARAARGTLKQVDSRVIKSLPEIEVPTLALVGDKDRGYLAGTSYMAAKIPGAVHVVISDAGHATNIQQPEAFNKAVRTFLAGIA